MLAEADPTVQQLQIVLILGGISAADLSDYVIASIRQAVSDCGLQQLHLAPLCFLCRVSNSLLDFSLRSACLSLCVCPSLWLCYAWALAHCFVSPSPSAHYLAHSFCCHSFTLVSLALSCVVWHPQRVSCVVVSCDIHSLLCLSLGSFWFCVQGC